MNNEPKLWDKLLNEAPFDKAILMGGAVVDYFMSCEAKDYDIFHPYTVGEPNVPDNWKLTVNFNDEAWAEAHQNEYLQGVDADNHHPIGSVYEYLVDDEHKVQLIGVNYPDPSLHFQNFDHSLTLGRYTKSGLFIHRKVFDSIEKHIVTYVSKNHDPDAVNRSYKRAKLKAQKYGEGDWGFKGFYGIPKKKEIADPFDF